MGNSSEWMWKGPLTGMGFSSAEHNASAVWTELCIKPQAVTSNLVKTKIEFTLKLTHFKKHIKTNKLNK